MKENNCPVCGSSDISRSKKPLSITEAFSGNRTVDVVTYHCNSCGSDGDFFDENQGLIDEAIKHSQSLVVANVIDYFERNQTSLAGMERALGLPQRTLTKWKTGALQPSSSAVSLFKFLRIYPWLLSVAEHKYDYVIGQRIHVTDALKKVVDNMSFGNDTFSSGFMSSDRKSFVYLSVESSSESVPAQGQSNQPKVTVY